MRSQIRHRLLIAGAALFLATPAFAQAYEVPRHVVAGGGGESTGGTYTLRGTIGQLDAGEALTGGTYSLIGGFWAVALASAPFTDDPLVATSSFVRALHVTELRSRINALRTRFALGAATWTNPSLGVGTTMVTVAHVAEMRNALLEAYTAAGVTQPVFTDPTLTPGATPVRAVHMTQLRAAVQALEEQ